MGLSAFFHSWGLPREPQEAQEGSQEAPKELQDLKKKEAKIGTKNWQILDEFWNPFFNHKITKKTDKHETQIFDPSLVGSS